MNKEQNIKELNNIVEEKFRDETLVLGYGSVHSKIVLIGEAPGKNEVEKGKPFVGAAGKYLDEFLDILELDRKDIYITNTVKYRPTKISDKTGNKINRTPKKNEIEKFREYLYKELSIIGPTIIVTLGNIPFKTVMNNDNITIGSYHGKPLEKEIDNTIYTIYPLYHPAAVIYNRSIKEQYINDLHNLKKVLNKKI
ncbi:uracil-DNA glycosylase [Clostridium sp. D2Q-11]|uniref:Type-4 uracil-DNA glycosylase n=1 Tax=Anaeromonas frigoriresistens TaxID=2683708 RepID=A0A942UU42_9FIRM|nr:uracil-DNA glycosylase [Anaeromonas frigoriresistens]MBS4536831.1 uracil-DNA glycosylase [Anaeromonas frigoriresistens]